MFELQRIERKGTKI